MTNVRPVGEPKDVVLDYTINVEDEWRENEIDLTGRRPPKTWYVEVPLKDVPDIELRRRLRRLSAALSRLKVRPVLREPPTGDLLDLATSIEAWLDAAGLADDAEEDPAARFERERREWIEAYASPRLRTASSRDYKVNRLYAIERSRSEYPGFYVDTNSSARWSERADPSTEALAVEAAICERIAAKGHSYRARIVWLAEPPKELDERLEEQDEVWEQQEAIWIGGYLGRYDLYLPVDSELYRESDDGQE
jgi:hypothetical protein